MAGMNLYGARASVEMRCAERVQESDTARLVTGPVRQRRPTRSGGERVVSHPYQGRPVRASWWTALASAVTWIRRRGSRAAFGEAEWSATHDGPLASG